MTTVEQGLIYLLKNDPVFSKQGWGIAPFLSRIKGEGGFSSLVRIIIGQQLSTKVADTLCARFEDGVEDFSPAYCAAMEEGRYRALGLSARKAQYIKGLAEEILSGALDLKSFKAMSDDDLTARLISIKGFGPWSAQMYLIFSLGRPDIWPAADLGIQSGIQKYHGLSVRPSSDETEKFGEHFAPYRTAAALLTWQYNHVSK